MCFCSPHSRHIGLCSALSQMRACVVAGETLVMQAHPFLMDRSRPAISSSHARCLHDATTPITEPSCLVRKVGVICKTYCCLCYRIVICSYSVGFSVPLSASELSLTEGRDKVPPLRRLDPGLMPLPDTACGLEWSSLVNAAKAYEGTSQCTCE